MDRDRFESFMDLARFKWEVRKDRMSLEWRIALGIWGGLLAVTYFVSTNPRPTWIVGLGAIGTIGYHLYIMKAFYDRSERDAKDMYACTDAARALLVTTSKVRIDWTPPDEYKPPFFEFITRETTAAQISATAVLSVLLVAVSRGS